MSVRKIKAMAAVLLTLVLSGCSYNVSLETKDHGGYDPDDNGFRLPDLKEIAPDDKDSEDRFTGHDTDTHQEKSGYTEYELADGLFTFQLPDDVKSIPDMSDSDYICFSLDGSEDMKGSYISVIYQQSWFDAEDIPSIPDECEIRKYRINGRDALVEMFGTTDPVGEEGTLDLLENTIIKYDDYDYIIVSANTTSSVSREDFYRQRLIVKDMISSIRYLGEE